MPIPSLRQISFIMGGLGVGVLLLLLVLAKADARHWHKRAEQEAAAHQLTAANFKAAQEAAANIAANNLGRVEMEKAKANERADNEIKAFRASTEQRYRRLLTQASEYRSPSGGPDLSADAESACRAYANAGCSELPAILLAAQQNTDQLIALQNWVAETSAIKTEPVQ